MVSERSSGRGRRCSRRTTKSRSPTTAAAAWWTGLRQRGARLPQVRRGIVRLHGGHGLGVAAEAADDPHRPPKAATATSCRGGRQRRELSPASRRNLVDRRRGIGDPADAAGDQPRPARAGRRPRPSERVPSARPPEHESAPMMPDAVRSRKAASSSTVTPSRSRVVGLAARGLADHDVVGLARDRRGHAAAQGLDQLARALATERGQGARDDEGLAGQRLRAVGRAPCARSDRRRAGRGRRGRGGSISSSKNFRTDAAMVGPMPWVSASVASEAAISRGRSPKRMASTRATRSPTMRMPSAFSRRARPRGFASPRWRRRGSAPTSRPGAPARPAGAR